MVAKGGRYTGMAERECMVVANGQVGYIISSNLIVGCKPFFRSKPTTTAFRSSRPGTVSRRRTPHANLSGSDNEAAHPSPPASPSVLTAGGALRTWGSSRRITPTDLSTHFISLLFVSRSRRRARTLEQELFAVASRRGVSRRLLLRSAGLLRPVAPRPAGGAGWARAVLEAEQLQHHDFVVCADRRTREGVLGLALRRARAEGGLYAEVERRVRLAADFEGQGRACAVGGLWGPDLPKFEEGRREVALEAIRECCEHMLDVLMANGL